MDKETVRNNQVRIVTDIALWNLLLQGVKKHLMERQRIALLTGDGKFMKGSVLEFSKAWGWDRDTVSRFLEKLQELGIVTMTLAGNRKAIKLNYITDNDF